DPNLLLVEALSQAGGIPQTIKNIYVIRQLPVSDDVLPTWNRPEATEDNTPSMVAPVTPTVPNNDTSSTNIEDLINQLDIGPPPSEPVDTMIPSVPEPDAVDVNELIEEITPVEETPSISPGIIQTGPGQLVDVDDLVPPSTYSAAPVDVDDVTQSSDEMNMTPDSTFIYVQETDSWVPVSTNQSSRIASKDSDKEGKRETPGMLERIIVIPWDRLSKGDSAYNIVVRPDDRIYVEPPPIGNLYIRGEVARPGVFDYPISRDRITLSQFITAAGDLSPIAVPEKVSITRRLSDNLEATVTLNFAAILQKTEPDIYLKPSDHISVGTSWGATPMAIIRNGFRSTYGFGFLLDRNFGNDVFGVPPR
ncbi:MAG: SLBB domain-containing protein, partial [Phycisphaerales bacterium]|nr:SLBB domain-containing protein [Phycisphaerales bacterium]